MAAARAITLGVLIAGICTSCATDPKQGYSFSTTFPSNVKTVSVAMFDNYSDTPGVEAMVTEAITKEVQRVTGMRVVSNPAGADSKLTGVITGVDMRRLSLQRQTGLVQELAVQITVDFDWKDNRSGKVLVSRRGFASADTFVPSRPTSERIETGQAGAAQRLAKDLVGELRGAW